MSLDRTSKLTQRCDVLAQVINNLQSIYKQKDISRTQRDLLETIIGAAIWYLPECKGLYTGKISSAASEHYRKHKKYSGLTKEHCYPRKRAGRDFLTSENGQLNGEDVLNLFQKKFGRYNYVTKEENRRLIQYQRQEFDSEKCYEAAGIKLIADPNLNFD